MNVLAVNTLIRIWDTICMYQKRIDIIDNSRHADSLIKTHEIWISPPGLHNQSSRVGYLGPTNPTKLAEQLGWGAQKYGPTKPY